METLAALVQRGIVRVQHTTWNEGQYLKLRFVEPQASPEAAIKQRRCAPTATAYTGKQPDENFSVYEMLTFEAEPEWRPYVGKLDAMDVG